MYYRAYPHSWVQKERYDFSSLLVLPPSCLVIMMQKQTSVPMTFKLTSVLGCCTHCGVGEFVAPEGTMTLPIHVMEKLCLSPGEMVTLRDVVLPKATAITFRPLSSGFSELPEYKELLENILSGVYTCISEHDIVNVCGFELEVTAVTPHGAASLIDTDVEVQFDFSRNEAPLVKTPPLVETKHDDDEESRSWGAEDPDTQKHVNTGHSLIHTNSSTDSEVVNGYRYIYQMVAGKRTVVRRIKLQ